MIDAKTAFDSLSGDGVPEDRRTAVDIAAVKADLEDESNTSLRWIPGEQQASDDLTKWLGNGLMAVLLVTGRWCIKEDPAVCEKRKQLRERRSVLKAEREAAENDANPTGKSADVPLEDVQTSSEP